jgi:hypothetical protein
MADPDNGGKPGKKSKIEILEKLKVVFCQNMKIKHSLSLMMMMLTIHT